MQTAEERRRINSFLGLKGLPTLENPRELVHALGFLVESEAEFRSLLNRCAPESRREMYESLRPQLDFPVKPLDVYIAELGMDAAARQLPVMGEDGKLYPYQVPEVRTIAQAAVDKAFAKGTLTLTCRKCTRVAVFPAERRADAIQAARELGWTYDEIAGNGAEICPECPESN